MVEPTSRRGSTLLNGSPFSAASIAEASATISSSFTRRLFTSLGNQFCNEVARAGTVASDNPLRFSQCLFLSAYAQLPFSDRLNDQFVSRLQARRRAAFRRDYDATLLIDPSPTLHDTLPHTCHSTAYMAFQMPSDKRGARSMLKTTRDMKLPTAITGSYPRPLWYDASLGGRSFKVGARR